MYYSPSSSSSRMYKTEHFKHGRNYRSSESRGSSEKLTSNEEDVMRSLEFLKHVLESQYVRGDRVGIKNLFLHISKAPPELQKCCGKDIKEFKKILSKFPETFVVKNNYVCLNIFKDEVESNKPEIIDNMVSAQKAVEEICTCNEFGLKLQGSLWGLSGKVSLVAVALPNSKIFIFDIVACPTALTGTDLGKLLESEQILKVTHNCQNDAAALLNNYGLQLRNVFDTQCAFKTIQFTNPQMLDENLNVQYLNLYNLLDYYELRGDNMAAEEEEVRKMVRKDAEVWMRRPLSSQLVEYAAVCVASLLTLYSNMRVDRALNVNKVLYQNLVYEECFRFAIPLIIKRRQNVRQTALRSWRRQIANERRFIIYNERSNSKDQIWKNDYHVALNVAVNQRNGPRTTRSNESPQQGSLTQDLDTKYFLSNMKRYYFDIKEQSGVKFVKISEVSSIDQSRNLISVNLNLVNKFRDSLAEIQQFRRPRHRGNFRGRDTDLIHSVSIVKDTRRYLIDLKRNRRGYFVTISQMLPTGGKLSSIAFGMQDIETFIQILNDIGREFNVDEACVNEGNYMRYRNKRFFFNVNQNKRGTFMRISEVVSPNYQSSMTIAENSWDEFLEKFSQTVEAFRKSKSIETDEEPRKHKENGCGDP